MTDFENFGLGEDQPERQPERTLRQTVAAALKAHLGPLAGGLVGLAVAILFLTLGFWRTLLIGLCAVSYTHLDVYKRQLQLPADGALGQQLVQPLAVGLDPLQNPADIGCLLYTSRCV